MKTLILTALGLAAFLGSTSAAPPPLENRTIKDISDVLPLSVLQRSVSPKFYKSLRVSPIKGWVVVRAQLAGTHLSGMKIVRSSLDGAFDPLALKMAKEVRIAGRYSLGTLIPTTSVLMHLLIYQIADGTMALSFAHLDEPGGTQSKYFGCAKLLVLKSNGLWTEIEGPEGLQGKGWAIRAPGLRNDVRATVLLESIYHPALSDQ
ncbi:MAG: hypothetical protein DLM73_12600 [Chthoniobacterales bacterium]|nr:MAG: hypothetical protein DLM73_12600 [Chthoniobacterales bacterium]